MKLSKFNIKAVDSPKVGLTAVFNTLTRGMAVLEGSSLEGIEKGDTSAISPEEKKSLEELGVLVPKGLDEDRFFDVYYNQVRFDSSSLRIVLHTTLNCNFACPYCYEEELTYGKKKMSLETADRVISWMKERALEMRVSRIRLEYIGGEPLLNLSVIKRVGSEMVEFCKEKRMTLDSVIITNGYLLTRDTAERIKSAGVEAVRVTIDGPEDYHDSLRYLRGSGGKTYKTIIKNLISCKDILSVSIIGNFTKDSVPSMPRLLDALIQAGLGPDDIDTVQLAPVIATWKGGKAAAFDRKCVPPDNLHDVVIAGHEELIKRGYGNFSEPEFSPCPVLCSGDYTVNWDGGLYKCPCLVDQPVFAVGHVGERLSYNTEMVNCLGYNTFENKKCRSCAVLPLCLGGCRYISLVEKGSFHTLDCRKEEVEALTLRAVKRMASGL